MIDWLRRDVGDKVIGMGVLEILILFGKSLDNMEIVLLREEVIFSDRMLRVERGLDK